MTNIVAHIIMSALALILGQAAGHLVKKMPPVVSEKITYKEFFKTLFQDFKIDFIYTLILLVLYNAFVYFLGNVYSIYLYAIVLFALVIVFNIDSKYRLIPDEAHIVIVACSIVNLFFNLNMWWSYLAGAVVGGLIFWLLGLLALLIFRKEGMGFGDVKLMAALGLFFGLKNILVVTLVSFVFGAVFGVIFLIIKRGQSDGYIPFGPFIVIGAVILMFVPANDIINIYITFCKWLGDSIFGLIYKITGN